MCFDTGFDSPDVYVFVHKNIPRLFPSLHKWKDGTLINTKSGAPFAKGPEDWKFWGKKVPSVLKDLEDQGYKIVLFR